MREGGGRAEELGIGRWDVRGLSGFVGSVSVLTAFSHPDVVESSWWSGKVNQSSTLVCVVMALGAWGGCV